MNSPHWLGKIRWLPRGYRLKLFLTFLVVLVLCGGSLILLFGQFQKKNLLKNTYNRGKFISSVLSRTLETPLFFMNREQINTNVEAMFGATGLKAVLIYDKDGTRILTRFAPDAGKKALTPEEFARLAQIMKEQMHTQEEDSNGHWNQKGYFVFCKKIITVSQPEGQSVLYFDTGKVAQGTVIPLGGVQVIFSRSQYEQGMHQIVQHAALIFFSFLPISLLVSVMLARDVIRPLRSLAASLKTKLGNTAEEEKATDELGQLDISFKHLLGQLDSSFATIARMNEGLEETVALRTAELTMAMQELKETQAQLVQSEKMVAVGQLVAGVAHEVNNTTNFVTGALPPLRKRLAELDGLLVSRENGSQPDIARSASILKSIDLLLNNIAEGARRTTKIVNDLKSFSRPDDEEFAPVDIALCLENTLSLSQPEYRHTMEVIREFAPDLPKVFGSQGQLSQVFMNLIINALHAQPDKGSLLIRTFSRADGVHVVFKDKGMGIPKHIQDKIFDPFFTTKEVGKGTGLGLSISFGIIKKHRGNILVRSKPGQGAEFELILPAWREKITASQHEEDGT